MRRKGTLLLPREYLEMEDAELLDRVREKRVEIGDRMTLLAHHYQRSEVVDMADFVGDSFYLARMASLQEGARYIVFCGVHFMAESADILSSDDQVVLHPDLTAGCPMAEMADISEIEEAWSVLGVSGERDYIPVTYMNSDAELKAFCGRWGGAVCTSSNASAIFDWVFEQGKRVFFFPDEHLGRNVATSKGIGPDEIVLWDRRKDLGGNSPQALRNARVVVWKGFCHVHTWFKPAHIAEVRRKDPEARIIVHPECTHDVVVAADANGSTRFIVDYVDDLPSGSTVYIGTEIHLVTRLARDYTDKRIFPLARSLCPNMYKVSINDLLWTLDNLGEINIVKVPPAVKKDALVALDRMLSIT
jgi:quinolinate synthase